MRVSVHSHVEKLFLGRSSYEPANERNERGGGGRVGDGDQRGAGQKDLCRHGGQSAGWSQSLPRWHGRSTVGSPETRHQAPDGHGHYDRDR